MDVCVEAAPETIERRTRWEKQCCSRNLGDKSLRISSKSACVPDDSHGLQRRMQGVVSSTQISLECAHLRGISWLGC